jgi:hypothetical protein
VDDAAVSALRVLRRQPGNPGLEVHLRPTQCRRPTSAPRWCAPSAWPISARRTVLSPAYSGHNHVKALKAEAARVGLSITYQRTFDDSVTDFRSMIAEAQASHPDVNYKGHDP